VGLAAAASYKPKSVPARKSELAGHHEIGLYQQFIRLARQKDNVDFTFPQSGD
jgi:hypothetical protein